MGLEEIVSAYRQHSMTIQAIYYIIIALYRLKVIEVAEDLTCIDLSP